MYNDNRQLGLWPLTQMEKCWTKIHWVTQIEKRLKQIPHAEIEIWRKNSSKTSSSPSTLLAYEGWGSETVNWSQVEYRKTKVSWMLIWLQVCVVQLVYKETHSHLMRCAQLSFLKARNITSVCMCIFRGTRMALNRVECCQVATSRAFSAFGRFSNSTTFQARSGPSLTFLVFANI